MAVGLTLAGVSHIAIAPLPTLAQTPPSPQFGLPAIRYRVVVPSANLNVLAQVRQVASGAFIQSFADNVDRIQAGAFAGEVSARQRVDELAQVGIGSVAYNTRGEAVYQSTPTNNQTQSFGNPTQQGFGNTAQNFGNTAQRTTNANAPGSVKNMPKGYYSIIPVDRDQLGITFEAVRKLGIPEENVTIGQQLRGWHVAIGVYANRAAADTMSQYLRRKGGFDARSYYER